MTLRFFSTLTLLSLIGCSSSKEFSFHDTESEIISANQWGGIPAIDSLAKKHSITHITLHHQGEPFPKGKDPIQYLRNLQSWSRSEKKNGSIFRITTLSTSTERSMKDGISITPAIRTPNMIRQDMP